jgi:hypothetical protein
MRRASSAIASAMAAAHSSATACTPPMLSSGAAIAGSPMSTGSSSRPRCGSDGGCSVPRWNSL